MVKNVRIERLDGKINQLQARKKKLEGKRINQLTKVLNRCGANTMPDEILAGAILEAVTAYKQNDARVFTWKSDGIKILKPGRGKKKFV